MVQGVIVACTAVEIFRKIARPVNHRSVCIINILVDMRLSGIRPVTVVFRTDGKVQFVIIAKAEVQGEIGIVGPIVRVSPSFTSAHGEVCPEIDAPGNVAAGTSLDRIAPPAAYTHLRIYSRNRCRLLVYEADDPAECRMPVHDGCRSFQYLDAFDRS